MRVPVRGMRDTLPCAVQNQATFEIIALHVRLLTSYLGTLEAKEVHDGTLEPFVADRLAAGVSPTTISGAWRYDLRGPDVG